MIPAGPYVASVNVGRPRAKAWAGLGRTAIDKRPVTGPVYARRLGVGNERRTRLDRRVIPAGPYVASVNVGKPRAKAWAGLGRTAIDKRPVTGPVYARRLGLEGDEVGDTLRHGGVDQAVYCFAREDLDWWADELGRPIRDGGFGENLTTNGMDVNEAVVGERWVIGSAVLEVASVRIPCNGFRGWQHENGYDARGWVKRFAAQQRTGPYLRVIQEGAITAGDRIDVVHRPGHGVTVTTMFRALTTDRHLLPELLRVDGLAEKARRHAESYLDSVAANP